MKQATKEGPMPARPYLRVVRNDRTLADVERELDEAQAAIGRAEKQKREAQEEGNRQLLLVIELVRERLRMKGEL
jgi:hypothetical protein